MGRDASYPEEERLQELLLPMIVSGQTMIRLMMTIPPLLVTTTLYDDSMREGQREIKQENALGIVDLKSYIRNKNRNAIFPALVALWMWDRC